ncbi:hypothetical protein LUZ60_000594 [Juncus effusus]|nr:hypothetical protein LUZ60_000594 [Juncus effusus]
MAFKSLLSFHIPTLIILLILSNSHLANCCFTRIFCFGDSISDTGNFLQSLGNRYDPIRELPYGETYFRQPTGRFSDGRLIIDFIAETYGLPYIPAYLAEFNENDFPHGVNFAVGGATALGNSFFASKGIKAMWTDYSLGIQLQWFRTKVLPSILRETGCANNALSNALFVVGEIGGNDYNHPFFAGNTVDKVKTFVPSVIRTISSTIHELIILGAKTLLVPNNFPIGCVPIYLTIFQSERKEDYDSETGCIKWLNEFSQFHNLKLEEELDILRQFYPNVTIIYADYFEASMDIFRNPNKFGFDNPLIACCGSNGPYNYNPSQSCGNQGSAVCFDPSRYVSWDGIHLTEAAYRVITYGVMNESYTSHSLTNSCSNSPPTQCSR